MDETKRQKRLRRSFTDEFKSGAVRLVVDEGKTVMQVARDLDFDRLGMRQWVERARADRSKGKTGLTSEERVELARLRKEVRELRMEREILKKPRCVQPVATRSSARKLVCRSTSAIPRVLGSEAQTRTRTGRCGSTSPTAWLSRRTASTTST